ncbi:hypothetical protein ACJX0J_018624, partial [Zea mays]
MNGKKLHYFVQPVEVFCDIFVFYLAVIYQIVLHLPESRRIMCFPSVGFNDDGRNRSLHAKRSCVLASMQSRK